jgi:hypothetical protein
MTPSVPGTKPPCARGPTSSATTGSISGLKNRCAIKVGTMALPITTVTKIEYCSWLMEVR